MLGPVSSSLILLPRFQLHFKKEKVVTLKYIVARLVGPDCGGRKEAMTLTVEADLVDSGADVSYKLVVAHFCVRPE